MEPTQYLSQVTNCATTLAQSFDLARALHATFFDRNYGQGAAGEISDEQLASAGLTRGQLVSFITLAEQLQKLRDGQQIAPGDYDSTLNALRRDL